RRADAVEAALVVRPHVIGVELVAGEIFRVRQHIADLDVLARTYLDVCTRSELGKAHTDTEDRSAVPSEQAKPHVLASLEIEHRMGFRQLDGGIGKLRNLLRGTDRLM